MGVGFKCMKGIPFYTYLKIFLSSFGYNVQIIIVLHLNVIRLCL